MNSPKISVNGRPTISALDNPRDRLSQSNKVNQALGSPTGRGNVTSLDNVLPVVPHTPATGQRAHYLTLLLLLLLLSLASSSTVSVSNAGRYESAFFSSTECTLSLIQPDYTVQNSEEVPSDVLMVNSRCPVYYVGGGVPYLKQSQPAVITFCPQSYTGGVLDAVGYPILYYYPQGGVCYPTPDTDTWDYYSVGCTKWQASNHYRHTCAPGGYVTLYHPYTGTNPHANCTITDGSIACDCPSLRIPLYVACLGDASDPCASGIYLGAPDQVNDTAVVTPECPPVSGASPSRGTSYSVVTSVIQGVCHSLMMW
jgi:hypothetical protein